MRSTLPTMYVHSLVMYSHLYPLSRYSSYIRIIYVATHYIRMYVHTDVTTYIHNGAMHTSHTYIMYIAIM